MGKKQMQAVVGRSQGLDGTAAPEHQMVCSAIITRLNLLFKRSRQFSRYRAIQEMRSDNKKKNFIVPDVTVTYDLQNPMCQLLVEVCHSPNIDAEIAKVERYLKDNGKEWAELFVLDYDNNRWHRIINCGENDKYEIKQTSYSPFFKFNLNKCLKWFEVEED